MTIVLAMMSFALVMSITPGPVNVITLTSGVNYGFKQTLPYVLGATSGCIILLLALGMGLSSLVGSHPIFLHLLAYAGTIYMLYMGWKIATAKPHPKSLKTSLSEKPKLKDGLIMQWSNPKAWMACLSGIASFTQPDTIAPLLIFASLYFVICYLSIGLWAWAGDKLSSLLHQENVYQRFNRIMGGLLAITALYLAYIN